MKLRYVTTTVALAPLQKPILDAAPTTKTFNGNSAMDVTPIDTYYIWILHICIQHESGR